MRWIVRIVLGLVALIVIGLGILAFMPTDRIARIAADRFTAATGRSLTLAGDIRPTIWPTLGLSVGGIEIGNAAWSDAGPMLRADKAAIGVDLAALFSGDIRVQSVVIERPQILLERGSDGRVNWDFAPEGAPARAADTGAGAGGTGAVDITSVSLEDMRITDASLIYDDRESGRRIELSDIDARISLPAATGRGSLKLSGAVDGVPLDAEVAVEQMAAFLSGQPSVLGLDVTAGANRLSYDGSAGFGPLMAEGALEAALPDPGALARLANAGPVSLPAGLGTPRLSGDLKLSGGETVTLDRAVLELGGNRLNGQATLVTAPRPRLTADLTAKSLDLSAFGGSGGGASAGGTGWPRDPIDASGLGAVDAAVTLRADAIKLGATGIGRTDLAIALDNGRLVTRLREVRAFQGNLTGELVVNARSGLSVAGDLVLADLALQPALSTLAGMNRLAGTGNGAVTFQSSGASVDALMKGLSGKGRLAFTNGEILGLDLVGMLRTLDTSYMGPGAKTIFDSITGTFTIDKGVLRNDDMVMTAPLLRAEGNGTVNIGAQSLSYRVTPIALSGADGSGGLRVPLLISGPWAAPAYKLDLEGAAKQNLVKEREALEQKAKDALGSQAEKLGITPQTGESTGDAAKRAIEDKAKDALKGLLGR